MARSKDTSLQHQTDRTRYREILGIFLLALSVFAIVTLYTQSPGWIGRHIRPVLQGLFGDAALLFALSLLYLSLNVFRGTLWPVPVRKILGFVLLLGCVVTAYHLAYYRGNSPYPSLPEELARGWRGEGAGITGAIDVVVLNSLASLGRTSSWPLFLVGIILYFHISLTHGEMMVGTQEGQCMIVRRG